VGAERRTERFGHDAEEVAERAGLEEVDDGFSVVVLADAWDDVELDELEPAVDDGGDEAARGEAALRERDAGEIDVAGVGRAPEERHERARDGAVRAELLRDRGDAEPAAGAEDATHFGEGLRLVFDPMEDGRHADSVEARVV